MDHLFDRWFIAVGQYGTDAGGDVVLQTALTERCGQLLDSPVRDRVHVSGGRRRILIQVPSQDSELLGTHLGSRLAVAHRTVNSASDAHQQFILRAVAYAVLGFRDDVGQLLEARQVLVEFGHVSQPL
jgi:hypothetical protein